MYRPVSDLVSRRALRSSVRGELWLIPRARSALKQRRAFSVVGPSTWNELPLMYTLRLLPRNNVSSFCKLIKTFSLCNGRSWTEIASDYRFLEGALIQGCKSLFEVGGLFYGREAISSFSGGLMQYL